MKEGDKLNAMSKRKVQYRQRYRDTDSALSLNIKQLRQKQGLTLVKFGQQFNPPVSKSLVYAWENGKNKPNMVNLKQLLSLSGETYEQFVFGDLNHFLSRHYLNLVSELENPMNRLPVTIKQAKALTKMASELIKGGFYTDPRTDQSTENINALDQQVIQSLPTLDSLQTYNSTFPTIKSDSLKSLENIIAIVHNYQDNLDSDKTDEDEKLLQLQAVLAHAIDGIKLL